MACAVHTGGAGLVMIRLLSSPVQWFLCEAVDFSPAFLSSSVLTYPFPQCQPLVRGKQSQVRR